MKESSQNEGDPDNAARAPRRQRGQARVEALLAAAAQVFADKGFDAATMTEIAQRAQSAVGSLYQFFPTKESIAQQLLQQQVQALRLQFDAMRAASPGWDLAQLSVKLCGALVRFRAAHPSFARLIETPGAPQALALEVRREVRAQVAAVLAPHAPGLPPARLETAALLTQQLMKAAVQFQAEALPPARLRQAMNGLTQMLELYLQQALQLE